jgi:D-aminopeptidase
MVDAPRIGALPSGSRDSIGDVEGVTVGHATLADGPIQTGVTVIRPHGADAYRHSVPAAAVVINGFGKTLGLLQLNELGTLESPIALTNTFSVGTIYTAMIKHALRDNPAIGRMAPTLNPIVAECNDGWLNDLHAFAIREEHYGQALRSANADFDQGSVGAGRGMSCFGLKGGIGSASRVVGSESARFVVAALVLANFGRLPQLTIRGIPLGRRLAEIANEAPRVREQGSIIVVVATNAPLDHRQLRRVAMRASAGIARTGSNFGHGSGDIVIAFATNGVDAASTGSGRPPADVPDAALDPLFDAAAESTEQSIVNALFAADTVRGYADHVRRAIRECLPDWRSLFDEKADAT